MSERVPYKFGQRMVKCEQFPKAWKLLTPNDIDIKKPCVICLGGNGAITDRLANGMAKMAENFIDENNENFVDIFSIHYGGNLGESMGNMTTQEVEELAQGIFYRRIVDENGKPYNYDEILKNMRNVNVFTFCFGANILKIMIDNVAQFMEYNLGFDEEEIYDLLGQVFHLSYAPSKKQNQFTTNFEIKSFKDGIYNFKEEYFKTNNAINKYALNLNDNTISLYVEQLADDESIDEHDISIVKRDENKKTLDKNANAVANTMSSVLKFAVSNSNINIKNDNFIDLPSIDGMMAYIKSTLNENYELNKIEKEFEKNN